MDGADAFLFIEGYWLLVEDPELWIQEYPSDLRRLKLDYSRHGREGFIGDPLGEFAELTHLSIHANNTITHLPDILRSLHKLKVLDFENCHKLQELHPNLGDLYTLTSLSLCVCSSIKSLPGSLGKLSNLTDLFISHCGNLEELPENFGDLESLTHFTLVFCNSIRSLPNSVAKLPKLTTLTIKFCGALQELPSNMGELKSLTTLTIESCDAFQELPANMGDLVDLNIKDCCSIPSLPKGLSNLKHLYLPLCIDREGELANLKYCVSLRLLKFWDCWCHKSKEFPTNVDNLPQLSFLDIQDTGTEIKRLPSSITELSKLRLLLLPKGFILNRLPYDLDESLVISVKDTHVRKTWKELKTEMEIFSFHTVGVNDSTPDETIRADKEPPMKRQHSHQQGQEHLNGTKERAPSTTGQPEASWSKFIVKACNDENGDIVRFDFYLSSNIDQLEDEIGRKLELEVGKFKIRYKDAYDEWVLLTCIYDLNYAQSLSGSNVVRLSIISET